MCLKVGEIENVCDKYRAQLGYMEMPVQLFTLYSTYFHANMLHSKYLY